MVSSRKGYPAVGMTFLLRESKELNLCRRRKGHEKEELYDEGGVHGLDKIERCEHGSVQANSQVMQ